MEEQAATVGAAAKHLEGLLAVMRNIKRHQDSQVCIKRGYTKVNDRNDHWKHWDMME